MQSSKHYCGKGELCFTGVKVTVEIQHAANKLHCVYKTEQEIEVG